MMYLQRKNHFSTTMMATMPHQVRTVEPHHRFKKLGSEEVHTIEAYERTIHGTPYSDPKREFSTNQYTERRTYGRDENGEIVVKIEKDPSEPVRPVSPVRPLTPIGGHNYDQEHLLKPLSLIDTTPLHIPRPKSTPSPRSTLESPKSNPSFGISPKSGRSSGFGSAGTPTRALSPLGTIISGGGSSIPMKKVIRKSRLVSIHDGRPVSPFVETVTYEPAIDLPPTRTIVHRESDDYVSDDYERKPHRSQDRSSLGNRSLHFTEDMETIPLSQQSKNGYYNRENENFYGTPNLHHQKNRLNNLRHEITRTHSDPTSYTKNNRRSNSTTATSRQHKRGHKTRDEGAWIIENPLYKNY